MGLVCLPGLRRWNNEILAADFCEVFFRVFGCCLGLLGLGSNNALLRWEIFKNTYVTLYMPHFMSRLRHTVLVPL